MDNVQDYYDYLGLPESASTDEIRRIINRMRRNCQDDVEKFSLLEEIANTLCDASKRKQYDINLQYGNQIDHLNEKINNSETADEREKHLKELRKLYTLVLLSDKNNIDALRNLVVIEGRLKNENQAVNYLKRLENLTEGEDKLEILHRLGELYKKQDKAEEAIRCFEAIYKADAAYVEDVKALVRLYYEKKSNIKEAIRILNDCINRCEDSRLKITYLGETLRAILFQNHDKYKKLEEIIYKKLEGFRSDNKEKNLINAAALLAAITDIDDERITDKAWFHRLEQIYLSYDIENEELNYQFEFVQQFIKLKESGKVHEAIELYLEDVWTDELREKLSKMILEDAAVIEESLQYIKKTAALFWNAIAELEKFEKIVMDNLPYSNELKEIKKDPRIDLNLKRMLELLMVNIFVDFEKIKPQFYEARDKFFDNEDKTTVQYSLKRLEEYYPVSFQRISDIFFEGKSTAEEFASGASASGASANEENRQAKPKVYYPDAAEEYIYKPYLSGFLELLFIVIATFCVPPVLPIIFIVKYYHRHQKKIYKILKPIADIFFEGKSTTEEFESGASANEENRKTKSKVYYPDAAEKYIYKPYLSGFWELLFIIIGTLFFLPILPIVFIVKYYHRHQKKREKIWKVLKPIFILGVIIWTASLAYDFASTMAEIIQYKMEISSKESHDGWLDDEVKKFYEIVHSYTEKVEEINRSDQDISSDMATTNDNQNSKSSGDEQNHKTATNEVFFDEITTQNTGLDKKIAKQYATILFDSQYGILPYGKSFEKLGNNDKYAINDIDSDGIQELIVSISDTSSASMREIVYEYDVKTETLIEQFQGFTSCTYYENGVIKEELSHNQGLGTTIWPYDLLEYVGKNQYQYILSIDTWDKSAHPFDFKGNAFPNEKDADGNGTVFIIRSETGSYICDTKEYDMTLKSTLNGAAPISLNWVTY